MSAAFAAKPVPEPITRAFDGAKLGLEIDMNKPKTGPIAFRPFEIVHKRPGEKAFDVDAFFFGPEQAK